MKFSGWFALVCISFVSAIVDAGELLYRDADRFLKSGCSMDVRNLGGASSPYYLKTFSCNGSALFYFSGSSLDNCYPSGGGNQQYTLDFRACNDIAISVSSANNVFDTRPQKYNYLAFSVDGVLDKPIILVEGFDPQNTNNPYSSYYLKGFSSLVEKGRDLYIVNFPKGGDSLDVNAQILQNIIKEIGDAKAQNFPITVIGYSMGGVVARKALKNMESQGVDHKVSLYVSYDAPHLGANVPVSLPETAEKITNELDRLFGYTPYELKVARSQYTSLAAKQLLIASPEFVAAKYNDFPQKVARVAVVSGSIDGDLQSPSVYKNQLVADYRYSFVRGNLGSWSVYGKWISQDRGSNYFDNVPGSFLYQFDTIYDALKTSGTFTVYNSYQRNYAINFIPSVSALSMPVSTISGSLKQDFRIFSPFDKYIAADNTFACGVSSTSYSNNLYRSQNIRHDFFDGAQLWQIRCAINEFQVPSFVVPDRSFKSVF